MRALFKFDEFTLINLCFFQKPKIIKRVYNEYLCLTAAKRVGKLLKNIVKIKSKITKKLETMRKRVANKKIMVIRKSKRNYKNYNLKNLKPGNIFISIVQKKTTK